MNLSCIHSLALLNNRGILLKIYFYKKNGNGKIFFNNFLDNSLFISLKKILKIIQLNFFNIYKIMQLNNVYIKISPNDIIFKNSSISAAIFLNFFCLFYNIKLNKKVIILGDIDDKGNFLNISNIYEKINILDNNYFIIIPDLICIDKKLIIKLKIRKIFFIKISNIFDFFYLFKIKNII